MKKDRIIRPLPPDWPFESEETIPDAYPAIDNDLARDNLENDLTAADLEDLRQAPRGPHGESF
ncbi:MAG: hypothetical protein PHD67_06685 [Oscillospiraceae bacterium]|nr:hypothetical protein [Oscillospiraceae bacterium]